MALSMEKKDESLAALLRHYDNDTWNLTETERQILTRINQLAADADIPLSSQSGDLLHTLLTTIKQSSSIENLTSEQAPEVIFGFLLTALGEQALANQSRHRSNGRFDTTPLYQRAERDQMQDHDMTLLMPNSTDNITVMAVINTHDNSAAAIQDSLASEIFDENVRHIIIPVGPGHWRGVYLTKHDDDLFDLELFDPYGNTGARAIEPFVLRLLEACGLSAEMLQIRYSGPILPQGDAYSCGDFTCAYSHKKMKEFAATAEQYNENLIATLDNFGNVGNVLRLATREEIRHLIEPPVSIGRPETAIRPVPEPVQIRIPEPVPVPVPVSVSEPVLVSIPGPVSEILVVAEKSVPATLDPVDSKPQSVAKDDRSTGGMTIGISTIIGACAGAIAGIVILPAVAVVTLAVFVGAGIGVLLGLAVNALSKVFASPGTSSTANNEVKDAPVNDSSTPDSSLKPELRLEQEPIISGPLFAPPRAKVETGTVGEDSSLTPTPR